MKLPNKLFHYSLYPIEKLKQDYHNACKGGKYAFRKPFGLWISIEDHLHDPNWKSWCIDQKFRVNELKHRYRVKLKVTANILHLSTTRQLVEFSKEFNAETDSSRFIYSIHWDEVEKIYDGIFISPYNWECRLDIPETHWYYGWDCASGCIWNVDAIDSLELESITEYNHTPEPDFLREEVALEKLMAYLGEEKKMGSQ